MADSSKQWRDNDIGRTVNTLDLRATHTSALQTKQQLLRKASSHRMLSPGGVPSPSAAGGSGHGSFLLSSPSAKNLLGLSHGSGSGSFEGAHDAHAHHAHHLEGRTVDSLRVERLEVALRTVTSLLEETVESAAAATDSSAGSSTEHGLYTVSFPAGAVGMILTLEDTTGAGAGAGPAEPRIQVAELRDDPSTGRPLLAKASGKIAVGDYVLAINHNFLARHGPPTLEGVAWEFKNAPRPVSVLFQRSGLAGTLEL